MPTEKSNQIVNAFSQYIKTQDAALINGLKLADIKFALLQFHADKNFPFYKAMEMRIKELEEKQSKIAEVKNMSLTEDGLKNLTLAQLMKLLSLGAWIRIITILGFILVLAFNRGYSIGFNKGKSESAISVETPSLQGLTSEQKNLLRKIWTYQNEHKINKVVIDKEGFVFDDVKKEKTKINLAEKALGDKGYPSNFQKLMVSMPAQFLKLIPETRWGSPYVVSVTEEVGKF